MDVHCDKSPDGRHEVVNWSSAHHGLRCFHCGQEIVGQDLVNFANAAMCLTAQEADELAQVFDDHIFPVEEVHLRWYAARWRGDEH